MSMPRHRLHMMSNEGGMGVSEDDDSSAVGEINDPSDLEMAGVPAGEARGFREEREGELTRMIAERERLLAEREKSFRGVILERELAVALAGRALVPGAAPQLMKLWREEFDVVEEAGEYRVLSRDGKSVNRAVEEWLASAEYSHFRPARSRGGSGTQGAQNDSAVDPGRTAETLGDSIVRKWLDTSGARTNGQGAIGLGGRRMR